MTTRRDFLLMTAAACLPPMARAAGDPTAAPDSGADTARLHALLDRFMDERLARSPEEVTSLGLDHGARAAAKSRLDDRSLAARARDRRENADRLARLRHIDRKPFQGMDRVNYDTVAYVMATEAEADRRFEYGAPGGLSGAGMPYALSQLNGAYRDIPNFLDTQHTIATKADADAYIARLEEFAAVLDQEVEVARHDAGAGIVAPDFILDKTLVQMRKLRGQGPDTSILVQSLVRRTQGKVPGDWGGPASSLYAGKIQPAFDRQIAAIEAMRTTANHDAGVWKLPDGGAYYAQSLKTWATVSMSPEEVHKTGLDLVGLLGGRIDQIMQVNGLTRGTVGERLRGLYDDPQFRYPNNDADKERLVADLNKRVQDMQGRLPKYFSDLPKAGLEIRRVPAYTEAGAPGGYYQRPPIDGSRPGIYFINLRDTAEVPRWTLPTLTYHEGIPGHHLQIGLQQEADLPLIRKASFFSAYGEGWALYAEQLADEMGIYDGDPWGRIGFLHGALFRAVRLVVDSGLHRLRWTREDAIRYFVDHLGDQDATATTEVERYCVWPGQACTYMLGKLTWLKLRDRAKKRLGRHFDLRAFHQAGLRPGATPLPVLETAVDAFIGSAAVGK
jgi:uncharacterized protein (DUF885 family)